MSGNAKDRRKFRRALARQGYTYVPPSDWRRQLYDSDVYLAAPDYLDTFEYPSPTGVRFPPLGRPDPTREEILTFYGDFVHEDALRSAGEGVFTRELLHTVAADLRAAIARGEPW